jgi:hypothetical protein
MTVPRPTLVTIAERLGMVDAIQLEAIVARRLSRQWVDELPALTRDEDPADILIDSYAVQQEGNAPLLKLENACVSLAERWARISALDVRRMPEPVGELHYLCARIGAVHATPSIAHVAEREDLSGVLLPGGEDLQLRSLRCLAGLLSLAPRYTRQEFQRVFQKAIDVPQHTLIALTALAAFDPENREKYEQLARSRAPLALENALRHLNRNIAILVESAGERG